MSIKKMSEAILHSSNLSESHCHEGDSDGSDFRVVEAFKSALIGAVALSMIIGSPVGKAWGQTPQTQSTPDAGAPDDQCEMAYALLEGNPEMVVLVREIAQRYQVPEWALLTTVARESSFNPNLVNEEDGIGGNENWNRRDKNYEWTDDGYPHGIGLTQITGWQYQGNHKMTPHDYHYAMAMQYDGEWVSMEERPPLNDPTDPRENLVRYLEGFAVPRAQFLLKDHRRGATLETQLLWEHLALEWRYGVYHQRNEEGQITLDPQDESHDPLNYLSLWRYYAGCYKEERPTTYVSLLRSRQAEGL